MSILSHDKILEAIENGEIKVEPFNPSAVGTARYVHGMLQMYIHLDDSIDLTLSNEFRYYKPGLQVLPVKENTNYKDITEKVFLKEGESYLLLPGQACLGITQETITLSPRLCGLLEGRSRFARLGLFVHITAGFMNPGINNRQVLEIYNASNHPLELWPGTRLCQFIFMRLDGEAQYHGRFTQNDL